MTEVKKVCKLCVYYKMPVIIVPEGTEPECINEAVNMKNPPYLVDGQTFKSCLDERSDLNAPCGQNGKLFKAASEEEVRLRLVPRRATEWR